MHALTACLAALLLLPAPGPEGWLGVYLAADRKEAVVAEVLPGSPASKAGLQAGDVLVAVGDKKTASATEFIATIRAIPAGERVRLELQRGGQQMTVLVKLGERPATAPEPQLPAVGGKGQAGQPGAESKGSKEPAPAAGEPGYLGIRVRQHGDRVVVSSVLDGSPASAAGIRVGEVLLSVDEQPIRTMADVDAAFGARTAGSKVVLVLRGPSGERPVPVELGRRPGPDRAEPAKDRPAEPPAQSPEELEREIEALRQELERLRRQLEELRKGTGRE